MTPNRLYRLFAPYQSFLVARLPLALLFCLMAPAVQPLLAEPKATQQLQDVGNKVVLELFTSQGCSSCPPADNLLKHYIAGKGVIALSLSVDYWDYLGWRDTFGQELFSKRQRTYARHIGNGMVYTPQMIVDGRMQMVGNDRAKVDAAIEQRRKARAALSPPKLRVWSEGADLMVTVDAVEPAQSDAINQSATLWLALVSRKQKVKIRKGENRGRYLYYHNVVRELTPIGQWTGEPVTLKLPREQMMQRGADSCVVLLQQGDGGPILAADEMRSW